MSAQPNRKLKLLYLLAILWDRTDEENDLTMPEIISALAELGFRAERKALYGDLKALAEFGDAQGAYTLALPRDDKGFRGYRISARMFDLTHVTMLLDVVQSSRFLTKRQRDLLSSKLAHLASKRQADVLARSIHVHGRIKGANESIFLVIDVIQEAVVRGRMVKYHYYRYDSSGIRHAVHGGAWYAKTPVALVYSHENYYAFMYDEKLNRIETYRVDRIGDIRMTSDKASENAVIDAFDPEEYVSGSFDMHGGTGKEVAATLRACGDEAITGLVDRFGSEIEMRGIPGTADGVEVRVSIMPGPVFFSWIVQWEGRISISAPASLQKEYEQFLSRALDEIRAADAISSADEV